MTRDRSLQLMQDLTAEERQSNILLPIALDEELPTFEAADRVSGGRLRVDVRTYDERQHLLLEDT